MNQQATEKVQLHNHGYGIRQRQEGELHLNHKTIGFSGRYHVLFDNILDQVQEDEIDNIQSLEDLMDYLSKKSVKGNPVLNDAVAEIILNMATNGAQSIADLISKDDRIYISIDYGKEKDSSVGFKAIKSSGLNTLSLVMKKDNKILTGQFNLQEFNKQLIFFRNSVIGA